MYKFLPLFWLSCLFFSCSDQSETANNEEVALNAEISDKEAVEAAVNKMKDCLLEPSEEKLNNLIVPQLSYGHSTGKIEDATEFKRVLISGENDYKSFEASEQVIEIIGNAASVRHIMDAIVTVGEEDLNVHLNVLTTWTKIDGQWKLFARQAIKI